GAVLAGLRPFVQHFGRPLRVAHGLDPVVRGIALGERGLDVCEDLPVLGHGEQHGPQHHSAPTPGRRATAGTPTATAPAGTSSITTALAPIRAPRPMCTPPRILAPA